MEAHSVDVLIIGAGIQGAWLLREALKRNLNAILIGKLDHAGESLHGHNVIQMGYFGASDPAIANVQKSWATMEEALKDSGAIWSVPVIHSYAHEVSPPMPPLFKASVREESWKKHGLPYEKLENPPCFAKDPQVSYYKVGDKTVDWRLSLQYLLKPNASRVFDGAVEELELSDDGTRVQQVRVKSGDHTLLIKPDHLFMAAGAWNYRLLFHNVKCSDAAAVAKLHSELPTKPCLGKIPMFCIRGPSDILPAMAGVSFGSRPMMLLGTAKSGNVVTWFATLAPPAAHPVNSSFDPSTPAPNDPEMIKNSWALLKRIVPSVEQNVDKLKFGFYFGWKCESPVDHSTPKVPYVTNFGLSNTSFVFPAVWPNTPMASDQAFAAHSFTEGRATDLPAFTKLLKPYSDVPVSHVETISLVSFAEFKVQYGVD